MSESYLIWSHEHMQWWLPGQAGYTSRLSEAGRYTHAEALMLCAQAIPGTARRIGALPELPVRAPDVASIVADYDSRYPDRRMDEPWE